MMKIDHPAFASVGALAGVGGVVAYVKGGNEPLSVPAYAVMALGGAYLLGREEEAAETVGGMLLSAGIFGGWYRLNYPSY
jgi:hypothetical protein